MSTEKPNRIEEVKIINYQIEKICLTIKHIFIAYDYERNSNTFQCDSMPRN